MIKRQEASNKTDGLDPITKHRLERIESLKFTLNLLMKRELKREQQKQFNLALSRSVLILKDVLSEFEKVTSLSIEKSAENSQHQTTENLLNDLKKVLGEHPKDLTNSVLNKHRHLLWKLPNIWVDAIRNA